MKKLSLLLVIALLFISCTKMRINSAYKFASKKNYVLAVEQLEDAFIRDNENSDLIKAYDDLYNKGINYYSSIGNDEKLYLLEENFLNLNPVIKNKFPNITLNYNSHINRGIKVANEIKKRADLILTNTYKTKVKKYNMYKYSLNFNPNLKKNINNKLNKLYKKIEKTYNIKLKRNYYLASDIENYLYRNLKKNYFQITNINPDMTLYISIDGFNYFSPKIEREVFPKHITKKYKNKDGKIKIKNIGYFQNKYTKKASLSFILYYSLISNKTGERLFSFNRPIDKTYEVSWSTYYIEPNFINEQIELPEDDEEKFLPNQNQIRNEINREITDFINIDFDNLDKINF